MNTKKFLLKHLAKNKFFAISSFGCFGLNRILQSISNYYYALLLGFIGSNPADILSSQSYSYILILAGLGISANLLDGIRTYFDYRLRIRFREQSTFVALFKQAHRQSPNFFNQQMSGTISNKIINLRLALGEIFFDTQMFFCGIICSYAVAFTFINKIDVSLGLSLFCLCIIAITVNYYHIKGIRPFARTSSQLASKVAGIITDSIANARLVKNCASFLHEKLYLRTSLNKLIRAQQTENKETGIAQCYNTLSIMFARIFAFLIIIYYWNIKNLSLTDMLVVFIFINTIIGPLTEISAFFNRLQKNLGKIDDAVTTIYQPLEITDHPNAKKLKLKDNSIKISRASFAYSKDKPLFKNLNLNINANEKIGIVGLSGSGKSTLINLLLRAYDLNSGTITISGQNIAKVTQYSLHQNIALISQEPCLFNRSVMDNIRCASPKASDEDVYKAAKLAHIHDVILNLPNGYNSVVGERGIKLSGGERQRITIAAAILKNTPILILDEATSALDSQSERAIEKALKNIMKNKTVIAIAHRLSTLKNMDRIIVLDNGKIIEDGTPQQLLKNKNGLYHRLYNLQQKGYLKI